MGSCQMRGAAGFAALLEEIASAERPWQWIAQRPQLAQISDSKCSWVSAQSMHRCVLVSLGVLSELVVVKAVAPAARVATAAARADLPFIDQLLAFSAALHATAISF